MAPTPYSMLPWRPPAHLVPAGDSGPQLAQAIAEEDLSQDLMDLVPTVTGAPFSIDDGPLGRENFGPAADDEEILPTELNEKQYARVILRRDFKAESLRRGMGAVKQVSRQEHALRRPRGPQGRFLRSGEEPAKPPPTTAEAQARLAVGASAYAERKASVRQRVRGAIRAGRRGSKLARTRGSSTVAPPPPPADPSPRARRRRSAAPRTTRRSRRSSRSS